MPLYNPISGSSGTTQADGFDGYVSGQWYKPYRGATMTAASSAPATTSTYFLPFFVLEDVSIDQIAGYVNTLAAAGNFQLAIYANNPASGRPTGDPLCKTGNISTAATGVITSTLLTSAGDALASVGLTRGPQYWLGVQVDNTTVRFQSLPNTTNWTQVSVGSTSANDLSGGAGGSAMQIVIASTTFGTWPTATAATFTFDNTSRVPVLHFRKL